MCGVWLGKVVDIMDCNYKYQNNYKAGHQEIEI